MDSDRSGGRECKRHGIELNREEGLEPGKPCRCWEIDRALF